MPLVCRFKLARHFQTEIFVAMTFTFRFQPQLSDLQAIRSYIFYRRYAFLILDFLSLNY